MADTTKQPEEAEVIARWKIGPDGRLYRVEFSVGDPQLSANGDAVERVITMRMIGAASDPRRVNPL